MQPLHPLDALPDFENYQYTHIRALASPRLIAWGKARECERRLVWYAWVQANNDQEEPKHLILLNDSLSAFLLSFEAAIQHAKDQAGTLSHPVSFDLWLASQPENDVLLKGLRALRHLDAHVQDYPVAGHIVVLVGGLPSSIRRWSLQELRPTDLQKLAHPPLKQSSLPAWNTLVQAQDAIFLMTEALDRLNALLLRREALA